MKHGFIGVGIAICCLFPLPGTGSELADVLREKGVLTEEDARRIEAAMPAPGYPNVRVGGRLMVDVAAYETDDADLNNGTEFRRAQIDF